MSSLSLDQAVFDRRLQRLDTRYRQATLQLDLARLEYYQLKRDADDATRIASVQDRVVRLTRRRDVLRAAIHRLEDLD